MKTQTKLNVVNEIKLSYSKTTLYESTITSADKIVDFLRTIYDPDTIELSETAFIIVLNRRNEIISYFKLSEGSTAGTIIDTKLCIVTTLLCNGHNVILSHNHPSGNLQTSEADEKITAKLKQAFSLVDIQLLDHIILTKDSFYSFANSGNL